MKSKNAKVLISTISLMFNFITGFSQQPYRIDPSTGLQVLDLSNNPVRFDLNYIAVPLFENQFSTPSSTLLDFDYGSNLEIDELSYIVLEDANEDNCGSGCPCNNYNFFGTQLQYPIGHTYQSNGNANTVKLITQKYQNDFIEGWYKNSSWCKVNKRFSYTTGQLNSKDLYKYGYFEARFKVNRPNGPSNIGIGQCFWLFPRTKSRNLPNYVNQYCYSEIDIAENQPNHGLHGYGAHVSQIDGDCPTTNVPTYVTSECSCSNCANGTNSIFNIVVEQEQFHTYALEWTPSSLKYFYDNYLITTINNIGPNGKTPENFDPMAIIFDIEAARYPYSFHGRCSDIDDNNTIFPFEFEIDYVRQYKLDLSNCNNALPRIYTQTGFKNFTSNPNVRPEILVGEFGNNYIINVSNGANVSLRAANLVELNEGFSIDTNSEFFADVIGGCDEGF